MSLYQVTVLLTKMQGQAGRGSHGPSKPQLGSSRQRWCWDGPLTLREHSGHVTGPELAILQLCDVWSARSTQRPPK